MCFDVEPCEVWCPKVRRARKTHRCDECFGGILPGERYLSVTGIFSHSAMMGPCENGTRARASDRWGVLGGTS